MVDVSSSQTEDILEEIGRQIPPQRLENFGVTVEEVKDAHSFGDGRTAINYISELSLVGIKMRDYSGRVVTVFATTKDAQQYKDWIVEE